MKKHARVLISGLVQGVFFRATAAYEARNHEVVGFARNLVDGRVEVVLEGEETSVRKMIEWCREGPPSARVEEVAVEWGEATHQFHSFTCR
ncbi:MAG: acylphosphatase [Omnitrophica bacterium RIFCSPLOWO2_12_FULL_50_11]|nr:MAG: acylphosphatase [Omnitrophica bacterium RIFCSPLOWO2_12_FULL_50_11]